MPEPTSPVPWTPGMDPTTELPPEFTDQLPGAIPRAPRDYVDAGPDQSAEPSPWPPVIDTVVRYAPVGTSSTWARLVRYATVHPEAHRVEQLWSAGDRDHAEELAGEQAAVLLQRKAKLAAGVVGLVVAGWVLVGAHGMWPLFVGSLLVPAWYTVKGRALVRRSTKGAEATETGPVWESRPGPPPGAEDQSDRGPEDHRSGPRGLLRLVHLDRTGPDADRTTEVRRTVPPGLSGPPRPDWLTQPEVQRRLLNAHKPLRTATPLRTPEGGEPVLIDLLDAEWTGNGWQLTLELPEDVTASKIMGLREDVARAFRVPIEQILMHVGAAHPGILVLWKCDHDPLKSTPKWSNLLELDEVNLHEGYVLGEDLFGREIRYQPIGSHCLTTGRSRSGKSVLQKLKLAHLLMDPHHLVVIIDPNGGEWRSYRDVAIYFGGPDAMGDALGFVRHAVEVEIPRRARRLAELKELYPLRIPELKIPDWLARDVNEDLFGLTVMIEEAPELFQGSDADTWNDLLTRFSAQYLKYLGQLDLTFQRVSNRVMGGRGTELRDLAGETAFCGSVRSESSARMALGDDWKKQGMNPLAIMPRVHAGTFVATGAALVLPNGADHTLLKSRFTDDSEGQQVRSKALELRRRVRPQLLPENFTWPGSAPKRSTGPTLTGETAPAPPLDPAPLRRIVEILEPNGTMLATAVIAELANRWPAEHGDLSTVADLNRLLSDFRLRTKQPVQSDGSKPHRLSYGPCAHRLHQLEAAAERGPEHPSE